MEDFPLASIDAVQTALAAHHYVAERGLATALFLSLKLPKPLFLEGEAGVGKTEVAKTLATLLGTSLIRLQCYEGLDVSTAVYEWNYARQMMRIRLLEAEGQRGGFEEAHLFGPEFLIKRPLLQAVTYPGPGRPVLLIDELDRADEEFEAFLLELLADFQITVPEVGTFRPTEPPAVVITSNRTREIHDALKRRCLYHWIEYPDLRERAGRPRRPPARHAAASWPPGRQPRAAVAADGPLQAARRSRDAGLDGGPARPGTADADGGDRRRHPRRAAQAPGGHRAPPGHHPHHPGAKSPGRGVGGGGTSP